MAFDVVSEVIESFYHSFCFVLSGNVTFVFSFVIFHWILNKHLARTTKYTYHYQYLPHTINYLVFFFPSRSRTVSLQASCQYLPESRSFSFASRSFSNLRSMMSYCAFVRSLPTNFSSLFSTESMSGQVMSGTFGAFFLIFDQ